MKYGTFDATGNITGHYCDDVHATIPEGSAAMTDAEWQASCRGEIVRDIPGARWAAKPVPTRTATQARAEKLVALAAHRYAVVTGGITVGGITVRTDRESQAQLNSAYSSLKDGLIPDTEWKGANGWVTVTLTEIQPIAQAVALHVRACFANEKTHEDAIKALLDDVAEVDAYDISGGWPT